MQIQILCFIVNISRSIGLIYSDPSHRYHIAVLSYAVKGMQMTDERKSLNLTVLFRIRHIILYRRMNMKKLNIYGDSILGGVILNKATNRYQRIGQSFIDEEEKKYNIEIENYSKFGCTIDKGYKCVEDTLERDLPAAAVIEYGGNDSDFHWTEIALTPTEEHSPKTPLDAFCAYMKKIIGKLREKNVTPILMTLPPIDSEKYLEWVSKSDESRRENIKKWLGDVNVIYRFHKMYSDAVARIAEETGCVLADVRARFMNSSDYSSLICEDGIHPTAEGYRIVWDVLGSASAGALA